MSSRLWLKKKLGTCGFACRLYRNETKTRQVAANTEDRAAGERVAFALQFTPITKQAALKEAPRKEVS